MKQLLPIATLFTILLLSPVSLFAQDPAIPPFYQVEGGLFYPGHEDFGTTFNAPSDFVWGMAMGLPVSADHLFLMAGMSWFKAKALTPGTPDVNSELSINFWHLGLLHKYFLSKTLAFRFQGGLNYNSIKSKVTPAGGTEIATELPRKLGFFGGIGFENQLGGGRMAIFADAVYDYRRSVQRDFYGDLGGIRLVAGLAAYWF